MGLPPGAVRTLPNKNNTKSYNNRRKNNNHKRKNNSKHDHHNKKAKVTIERRKNKNCDEGND